jgi:hypothetical protein
MKTKLLLTALIIIPCLSLLAGTSEQEKAFVDKYKTAFESSDKATLESFLYTPGANPAALEFYKMMQTNGIGGKITRIELVDLSPEDVKKADSMQDGPGGEKMRLSLKPTKKLKITVETKDGDSTSSSSTENFIAEKDGKFVIPVPTSAK